MGSEAGEANQMRVIYLLGAAERTLQLLGQAPDGELLAITTLIPSSLAEARY